MSARAAAVRACLAVVVCAALAPATARAALVHAAACAAPGPAAGHAASSPAVEGYAALVPAAAPAATVVGRVRGPLSLSPGAAQAVPTAAEPDSAEADTALGHYFGQLADSTTQWFGIAAQPTDTA